LVPIALIAALALLIVFSNRPVVSPDGLPVVSSRDQYAALSQQALELARPGLEAAQQGKEPTADQAKALTEAERLFTALDRYDPSRFTPPFMRAKIHLASGNYEAAATFARQAVENGERESLEEQAQKDADFRQALQLSVVEARYVLSQSLLMLSKFTLALQESELAVQAVPSSPDYLTQRGACYMELRQNDEAIADFLAALELEPEHQRARSLLRLIEPSQGTTTSDSP
jgi:tetratricopeptide (TPR) repeat protein